MTAVFALVAMTLLGASCSSGDDVSNTSTTVADSVVTDSPDGTAAEPDRSGQELASTTVFVSGEDGYATYRIPAIIEATDGTLIAFAEGRVTTAADDGNVDLLAKRSTDGGRTWGGLQVVADMGDDFIGNASPVLDVESGRIVLLATHKAGTDTEIQILTDTGADTSREFVLTSDDNGVSWSEPREITDSVKHPDWRWYAVGPGHAFQVPSGPHAGRLVAAANHSDEGLNYGAHLLLSDDGGETWRVGAVDTPQGGPRHPNESAAAVLADGTIVVSSRDQDGEDQWHRLIATSSDGGETFDAPFTDQVDLVIPVVQASLLAIDPSGGASDAGSSGASDGGSAGVSSGGSTDGSASLLLLSGPSDNDERVDLRVRTSTDAGGTWSQGLLIGPGPSGYSDLISLPGGLVGVLFETGDRVAHERIEFATFGSALLTR